MAHKDFLASDVSGCLVSGTKSECVSFGRNLKLYRKGGLVPLNGKRKRQPQFKALEARLVAYIHDQHHELRAEGANMWQHLLSRSAGWANEMDKAIYRDCKASPGWLTRVLKRNNIDLKNLSKPIQHGTQNAERVTPRLSSAQTEQTWAPSPTTIQQAPVHPQASGRSGSSMTPTSALSQAQQQIVSLRQFAIENGISVLGLGHLALFENELDQSSAQE